MGVRAVWPAPDFVRSMYPGSTVAPAAVPMLWTSTELTLTNRQVGRTWWAPASTLGSDPQH